jgi:flagellar protein FlbB
MARSLLLLLLILAVMAGGLVWFDYLGVIDAKTALAPVYNLFHLNGRSQPASDAEIPVNLDAERLAVRLESMVLRELEMDNERTDIERKRTEIEQIAAELETRQKAIEEKEKSIEGNLSQAEIRDRNIDQNARYLSGMPPANAVAIILAMDDQEAIDVLRKTEQRAQAEGTASIVSFWISQMPPERAADLQRKMAARP